jgi:cyclohexa-1,5-dienecarbonyl-CoA hydratase
VAEVRAELLESGGLLRLILDKPKGNILSQAMMAGIAEQLSLHEADRSLRLVVLQGANGQFCWGASVEEHRREQAPAMLRAFSKLIRQMVACPVPIGSFVEGRCLGGGFELVLASHLVFATPDAQMGCPEIKLGVFPPVLAALGPWRLGGGLSDRLLLTGETLSGSQAHAIGFAQLVAGFEDVLAWYRSGPAKLSAVALRNAAGAARLGAGAERLAGERLEALEKLYVEKVLPTRDGNEGIEAFLARRPPRWEDA